MPRLQQDRLSATKAFLGCAAVALLEGYDIQSIGVAAPHIAEAYRLAPQALGWLFSASLLGIFLGAIPGGFLGDRIGRARTLAGATAIFGLFSMLTPFASGCSWLLAIRFATGFGLGAAVPSMIAIVSSSASERWRQSLTTMLWAATPIGGMAVAFCASRGIAWQTLFYIGGILPILLAPALLLTSPHRSDLSNQDPAPCGAPSRAPNIAIWGSFFLTLMILYLLLNWLPTLLRAQGLNPPEAALGATMFNLGGLVGAIVLGLLLRVLEARMVVPGIYVVMLGTMSGFLIAGSDALLLMSLSFLAGATVIGGQYTLYGIAATRYADHERSSAMGIAVAIGRAGAFGGPLLPGIVLSHADGPMAPIGYAIPIVIIAGMFAFRMASAPRRDRI